ncbi:lipase family protein [Alloalcanivorax xenomutans]|uniref:lipase family protein n=1 Tax=Alloalcanivorax xenomutans TaxID=1094342 RepID=UPI003BAD3F0E
MAFFPVRRHWLALLGTTVVLTGCAHFSDSDAPPASMEIARGPAGLDFYTPPSPLPEGHHGDLIRARALDNNAALPNAAQNWLTLYRSTDLDGNAIAVSGTVAIPKGTPPEGGWPVISWTHGTTGIADRCAPSRNDDDYPARGYVDLMNETLDQWVRRGYAVVKTDYQGLGTPGVHPYLVGEAEARSAIDMVRAARQLTPDLSRDWLVMGHSQGGQAALYTAYLGPIYAPELNLTGAIAISPASHLSAQIQYALTHPEIRSNPYGALMLVGITAATPKVDLSTLLTEEGRKRIKQVDERCVGEMRGEDGWTLTVGELSDLEADWQPLIQAVASLEDTENLRPSVPLLILQSDDDKAVLKPLTDKMVARYQSLGLDVEYRTYHIENQDPAYTSHQITVPVSRPAAMVWAQRYLPVGH